MFLKLILLIYLVAFVTCLWSWINIVLRARELGHDIGFYIKTTCLLALIPIYNVIMAVGWVCLLIIDDEQFENDVVEILKQGE